MVGRPRKTELELLVTGQWRRDRHASRSQGATAPLGNPPKHLGADARRVWREVAGSSPWLRAPDRGVLEIYAQLLAEARADFAGMPASRMALLPALALGRPIAPG